MRGQLKQASQPGDPQGSHGGPSRGVSEIPGSFGHLQSWSTGRLEEQTGPQELSRSGPNFKQTTWSFPPLPSITQGTSRPRPEATFNPSAVVLRLTDPSLTTRPSEIQDAVSTAIRWAGSLPQEQTHSEWEDYGDGDCAIPYECSHSSGSDREEGEIWDLNLSEEEDLHPDQPLLAIEVAPEPQGEPSRHGDSLFSKPVVSTEVLPSPHLFLDLVKEQCAPPAAGPRPLTGNFTMWVLPWLMLWLCPLLMLLSLPPSPLAPPPSQRTFSRLTINVPNRPLNAAIKQQRGLSRLRLMRRFSPGLHWMHQLQDRIPASDFRSHQDLNKIIAAAEFTADTTLNSAKFASRTMASVAATRNSGLMYPADNNILMVNGPFVGEGVIPSIALSNPSFSPPIGGCLAFFTSRWEESTMDAWVLNTRAFRRVTSSPPLTSRRLTSIFPSGLIIASFSVSCYQYFHFQYRALPFGSRRHQDSSQSENPMLTVRHHDTVVHPIHPSRPTSYTVLSPEPRLFHQHQEEPSISHNQNTSLGSSHQHIPVPSLSISRSGEKPYQYHPSGSTSTHCSPVTAVHTTGEDDIMHWDHPMGTASLPISSVLSPQTQRSFKWWLSPALWRGQPFKEPERFLLTMDASLLGWGAHMDGQIAQGIWSRTDRARPINWLELRAIFLALRDFRSTVTGNPYISVDGQYGHKGTRQQARGGEDCGWRDVCCPSQQITSPEWTTPKPTGSARAQSTTQNGAFTHLYSETSPSDLGLQRWISSPLPTMLNGGDKCSSEQMAQGSPLRLSPSSHHYGSHLEDSGGTGGANSPGPLLAKETLVYRPGEPVCSYPLEDPSQQNFPSSGSLAPSGSPVVQADHVALERQQLREANLPERITLTIQASCKPSTTRIYNALEARVAVVLHFLQDGLEKGLVPNTLCCQVAALSLVLSWEFFSSYHTILLSRDLPRVLQALTELPFEPLRTVSLHFLTLKVVFLVAITSARRVSELAVLSTWFHRSQDIVLPDFCPLPHHNLECKWHTLDVRRALRIYLKGTFTFRKTEAMFVSFSPSHLGNKASPPTLSRWIRACIAQAYKEAALPVPQGLTAHSTRSAATSAAWATQASLEEICRAATWAFPSPFIRHYHLDSFASTSAAFGRRLDEEPPVNMQALVCPILGSRSRIEENGRWYNYLRTPFLSMLLESPAPPLLHLDSDTKVCQASSPKLGSLPQAVLFIQDRLSLMTSSGGA
ncbi:hypothetical protein L345_00290, partial [Ophiophagus hannah]